MKCLGVFYLPSLGGGELSPETHGLTGLSPVSLGSVQGMYHPPSPTPVTPGRGLSALPYIVSLLLWAVSTREQGVCLLPILGWAANGLCEHMRTPREEDPA